MTNDFKPAKAGGNQPRLSKEEYAEKKRAEKEKVYQMIDDAAREIVNDPEKFKSFLDTQSRMDRYSAANALLIYSQYPQATQLKDFDDWGKDNVKITKGAKSISILEPVEYTRADGSPRYISTRYFRQLQNLYHCRLFYLFCLLDTYLHTKLNHEPYCIY